MFFRTTCVASMMVLCVKRLINIIMNCRMMLLEENQIAFHSDDGQIVDVVKDYARQIADMIGLGSESDFLQAGVSFLVMHPFELAS